MAEVNYYFNARGDVVWTDPDKIVDNNLATFGFTATKGAIQVITGNNCPGTDLGRILKVELRLYGYGDGDDRIDIGSIFLGGDGTWHYTTPTSSPAWGAYQDITNDTNAPSPWTWADVVGLDCWLQFTAVAKGNTAYCAKVEIKVTYWAAPEADIDVGGEPLDRQFGTLPDRVHIDKNNPANASGTLHSIKVFAVEDITGFRVGTFYTTNGNTLKCRDSVVIGDVAAGAERTFTGLSIAVEIGDYIGFYFTSGSVERDAFIGLGYWYKDGEYIDPGDEAEYTFAAERITSLYGYGDIEAPPVGQPYSSRVQGVQGMRTWGGF